MFPPIFWISIAISFLSLIAAVFFITDICSVIGEKRAGKKARAAGQARRPRRGSAGRVFAGLALTVVALSTVGGTGFVAYENLSPFTDEQGRPVLLEDMPSESQIAQMNISEVHGDLSIPSVGLSTKLSLMSEYTVDGSPIINPPGLRRAYVVRGHGEPGSTDEGTTFVAMHSLRGGGAPGNKVIDVANRSITVKKGDAVSVQKHDYVVERTYLQDKTDTPHDEELWKPTNGRLIIITCLQRESGHSLQNAIIVATLKK